MNQILYTESKNKKRGKSLKIKTAVVLFSMTLIIFGASVIGKSTYEMMNKEQGTGSGHPLVELQQIGNKLEINIKHEKPIDQIIYRWGNEKEVSIAEENKTEVKERINIPSGKNKLSLKVIDNTGETSTYNKEYNLDAQDVIDPKIDITIENSKVKVVATDETAIDHLLYYWDNEDETKVDATESSPNKIEEKIDILKGEHELNIVAVDTTGNEAVKTQKFKGINKPKIEVSREGNDLFIKISSDDGIKKIEYTLNGEKYSTDPQDTGESLDQDEVTFRQPLYPGSNKIVIKAYSENDIEAEFTGEASI